MRTNKLATVLSLLLWLSAPAFLAVTSAQADEAILSNDHEDPAAESIKDVQKLINMGLVSKENAYSFTLYYYQELCRIDLNVVAAIKNTVPLTPEMSPTASENARDHNEEISNKVVADLENLRKGIKKDMHGMGGIFAPHLNKKIKSTIELCQKAAARKDYRLVRTELHNSVVVIRSVKAAIKAME